jgi:hypothetical protein
MSNKSWYSAQCIFLHSDKSHGPKQMYEERIVLLRADSMDGAIEQAEKEAEEYASDLAGCSYVGYLNVFEMYDEPGPKTEIFSAMRRSEEKPKEYLELHYPNEPDNCEAVGEIHRWHKLDDKRSACYHCKVIRVGQL